MILFAMTLVSTAMASATFKTEKLDAKIKGQNVVRLSQEAKPGELKLVSVDVAPGAGLGTFAWNVQLPDGRTYNLTGAQDAAAIEKNYEAAKENPYRDNLFFQSGFVASLYPLANRLLGKPHGQNEIEADVLKQKVVMPLNNKASIPNAIPHHLHGLLFGKAPTSMKTEATKTGAQATGEFDFSGPDWTGKTHVTTTTELTDAGYVFHMKVKNVGKTPVPVGAGAHPYFASPDQSPDSIVVHVPAKATADINNLSDVLPTGTITPLDKADPALDFRQPTPLHAKAIKGNTTASRLDNLWLEPVTDAQGFAYTEVQFPLSHFKVRMTALTKNIVGIQGYAPNYSDKQKPFVALELVTNLPDPREELWHKTLTGMKLLQPGETFEYGYKIEVSKL